MPLLQSPEVTIDSLGSGSEVHNRLTALLEVPDNGHKILFLKFFAKNKSKILSRLDGSL